MPSYDKVIAGLRQSYNGGAEERDRREVAGWKVEERGRFLSLLQKERKSSLLEIGAGAGKDSRFFQDAVLEVTCTDLSEEMVRLCREKGLAAHVMDFLGLDFPDGSFDAVYAMNCLLHVPTADLPTVLRAIQRVMGAGGLFFLGQYGGLEEEGVAPDDSHSPPRFFSYHSDDEMQRLTSEVFEIVSFRRVPIEGDYLERHHFQSLVLRRP